MVDVRNVFWIRKKLAKEVHTEYYFNDAVWKKIKIIAEKRKNLVWYIMTPVNYDYFRHYFGTKRSKKEIENIMSTRAKWLAAHAKIGLHIHFWRFEKMSYKEKDAMFKKAIEWGRKNGIKYDKFVSGWLKYDEDVDNLCKKYGLKISKEKTFLHDYEL